MMNEPYYCLRLNDPSTPAFCSREKLYFGNKRELLTVTDRMENAKGYADTVKGVRAFFGGNISATHIVAHRSTPALLPVECVCSSKLSLAEYSWVHTNTWGYSYQMRFEKADVTQLLLRLEQKYFRCLRAWITNLCYANLAGEWRPLDGGFWGHIELLEIERSTDGHFVLNNLLYIVEDVFDDLMDCDGYILNPDKLVFDGFCDEIFGNG